MRTDYILYIVAVICFIIAAGVYATLQLTLSMETTVAVLIVIGIIFIVSGYALRPSKQPAMAPIETAMPPTKPAMEDQPKPEAMTPPPTPSEPEPQPAPTPAPETETPVAEPTPTPEPAAEVAAEETSQTPPSQPETPPPETKTTRRRRKKTTTT